MHLLFAAACSRSRPGTVCSGFFGAGAGSILLVRILVSVLACAREDRARDVALFIKPAWCTGMLAALAHARLDERALGRSAFGWVDRGHHGAFAADAAPTFQSRKWGCSGRASCSRYLCPGGRSAACYAFMIYSAGPVRERSEAEHGPTVAATMLGAAARTAAFHTGMIRRGRRLSARARRSCRLACGDGCETRHAAHHCFFI
jgi:hypothetical protein